jgi:Beta-propeller repeat
LNELPVGSVSRFDMPTQKRNSLAWFAAALALLVAPGFVTGSSADAASGTVIGNAKLLSSTYLGEGNHGSARAVAVDAAGHIYVAGQTTSPKFPVTPGALRTKFPRQAESVGYVMELSADGSHVIYSTFFGGKGMTEVNAIAVDDKGDAFIGGATTSPGLATTPGGDQGATEGLYSGFVAELAPDGSSLLYSTYLGKTPSSERFAAVNAIAIDPAGDAYVTGATAYEDFPTTPGAAQTDPKIPANPDFDWDAFVTKLDPAGDRLLYSTFISGQGFDQGTAIAIDSAGDAYVTGTTNSFDFPVTQGAFQSHKPKNGFENGFVTKLNPDGSKFEYSTYLGGDGLDRPRGIAVDPAGDAYVSGKVAGDRRFPTTPKVIERHTHAFESAFVSVISPNGGELLRSTLLGGETGANGLAIDSAGNAYVAGFQAKFDGDVDSCEGFLAELSPGLDRIQFRTPLGGKGARATNLAIGPSGDLYAVGRSGRGLPQRNAINVGKIPHRRNFSSPFLERLRP